MKNYSPDFRERVVRNLLERNTTPTQLYKIFKTSRNTIYLWLKKYKNTGSLERTPGSGKKPQIDALERFKKIVDENPDSTQKELGQLYGGASQPIVCRAIKKIGYTYKKKTSAYQERNEIKRKRFQTKIDKVPPEDCVYIDETGVHNGSGNGSGYAPKGERYTAKSKARASDRRTVVGAQNQGKSQAMMVFKGNMNKEIFIKWVKEFLIPTLQKGNIVIMDNASFHKDGIIRRLLRKAGYGLWYLPPYSPDLNKIEHYWSKVKKFHSRHMKKHGWRNGESVIESLQLCPNLTE